MKRIARMLAMTTCIAAGFALSGCDTTSNYPSDYVSPYPYAYPSGSSQSSQGWDPDIYNSYVQDHYAAVNGASGSTCRPGAATCRQ